MFRSVAKLSQVLQRNYGSTRRCFSSTVISRMMFPSHANPSGNVHGGTILHMIDEAGSIAALRHCNADSVAGQAKTREKELQIALSRIDQMSFQKPMFVGEVANVEANVSYTSKKSLEVSVTVTAENLSTGEKRRTNQATLWYVPVQGINIEEVGQTYGKILRRKLIVPEAMRQLELSPELSKAGKERYLLQKNERASKIRNSRTAPPREKKWNTLAEWILPDDCNKLGNAQGGVILKLIDNAAAVSAVRHTRTNAVTALIEALDFVRPITLGQLVEVDSRIVYTSSKSMEIKVEVYAEDVTSSDSYMAVSANLVFVGLNENNKVIEIPQLPVPSEPFYKSEYDHAAKRHEQRRAQRKQ